ncbi:uncharacterized protein LOC129149464 [Eptesicus fuscus]|uniref:uncharacterized protein LOC129149464 n=1 Tax=Eptesicus fuscus TaxID=29078 RepID=UPI002403AC20|nr:uncharacterized protein LOC129149464 [Eptesicus fuscus]
MAVRTRPPSERPRTQEECSRKPESEKSLLGGLAAVLQTRAGVAFPTSFLVPTRVKRGNPAPRAREAGSAERMPGGVVFGSGRKSAGDGRGRAPGRPADYKSLQRLRRRSRLRVSRARAWRESRPRVLRELTRGDLRAPLAGLPTTPRGRGKCARPACVELPGTRRRLGRPFVYSQTEGAPVCTPPPGLFSCCFHGGGVHGLSRK